MCKLEHEIVWKPIAVTFDCFIEPKGRNSVKSGQIPVQDNSFTACCYNQGRYVNSCVIYHVLLHILFRLVKLECKALRERY